MWALEAHVDGEMTGTHTFQILASERPAAATTTRSLLTPSDIYKQATGASVMVEHLDAKHQRISAGSGFFIEEGFVVTAFQVIDGATMLRIIFPDGHAVESDQVLAWNRLQDWAVLKLAAKMPATLQRAKAKSWSVGDRCFSFDVQTEGNHVIVDENITGSHSFPEFGDRFNVSSPPAGPAIGSPVLNEYGDVISVLGGAVLPGARRSDSGVFTVAGLREGGMATPIEMIPVPPADASASSLSDLKSKGLFVD